MEGGKGRKGRKTDCSTYLPIERGVELHGVSQPVACTCIDRSLIQPNGIFPDRSMQDEHVGSAHSCATGKQQEGFIARGDFGRRHRYDIRSDGDRERRLRLVLVLVL